MCCEDPAQVCVVLYATQDTAPSELVATIDAAFPEGEGSCFGLSVRYGEPPVLE